MAWQITQMPHQKADPPTKSDWFACLKSGDDIHVLLQIGYQADQARANEIVAEFAGIIAEHK